VQRRPVLLGPEQAFWATEDGGSTTLLMYEDLRKAASPKATLLEFLESAYQAGARTADWDLEAFKAVTVGCVMFRRACGIRTLMGG
jgi:hypothetical protein